MNQHTEHPSCYRDLSQRLNAIPNGFPATQSDVELRLLAKMYSPGQAALAALMRLTPETSLDIAVRAGLGPDSTHQQLRDMARVERIRSERSGRELEFGLMPFVVGVYEAQLNRLDKETATLFEDYFAEGFAREVLSFRPSLRRIVPIEQSIPTSVEVFPYEKAS